MADKGFYDNPIGGAFKEFPFIIPRSRKKAKAKEIIDYYDRFYGGYEGTNERIKKFNENYNLYNGRWPEMSEQALRRNWSVEGSNVSIGGQGLRHFPVIDRVAKAIVGDMMFSPLIPIVRDESGYAVNQRKSALTGMLKEYLQSSVIEPIRQQVIQQYQIENGIVDIFSLSPEQKQQMQADVERRTQEKTPREIKEAMNSYQTPEEKQGQLLIDYLTQYLNVKEKFDMGGEHAVITGEEYYRLGIRFNEPFIKTLSPRWVTWGASERTEYVEDAEYAKYEQYLRITDVANEYVGDITRAELKKLQDLYSPIPGFSRQERDGKAVNSIEKKRLDIIADNPELQNIDGRTREGQEQIKQLYKAIDTRTREGYGIRESYVTWKWLRKLYVVTRIENGKETRYIQDENYEMNPFIDKKMKEIHVQDTWEGTKLGEGSGIYVRVQQVPYQYRSLQNPMDSKLTIYGGTYNTLQNNVKNVAPIDLGKPWQYRFNVSMERLEEFESTNIGKVLLASTNSKPANWTWQEWFSSLVNGKVALVGTHKDGITQQDASFYKSIDLSNVIDMAGAIEQLNFNMNQMFSSMYYNASKLGQISPYLTSSNNQANIAQADRQLAKFHGKHLAIGERVLNGLLHMGRVAYKDNPLKKSVILDDYSRAELDLDTAMMQRAELSLFVVNDFRENEKLERLRAELKTFIQNQYGSMRDLIRLTNARSTAEMLSIADDIEQKAIEQARQRSEAEAQAIEKDQGFKERLIELTESLRTEREELRNQAGIERTIIESDKFSKQYDINENKVNDLFEQALLEMEEKQAKRIQDAEEKDKQREFEEQENEKDRDLERELHKGGE